MRIFHYLITAMIAAAAPITLFITGWWLSIPFVPENRIYLFALSGLLVGIIIDLVFVRAALLKIYEIKTAILIPVYFLYSCCLFGFFMGIPVSNIFLGVIAGYYMGKRLKHLHSGAGEARRVINATGIFAACLMSLVSLSSAFIALIHPGDTISTVEMMLASALPKYTGHISIEVLCAVIISGGLCLIACQYWLTRKAAQLAYK